MLLEFTEEQLHIIDKALQQMPFYLVAPLIDDINKQIASAPQDADTKQDIQT